MKKIIGILSVLILGLLLTGCGKNEPLQKNNKLVVYTSFYTMADFTKKIGGDKVEVINLLPPGVEAHDWEPTTTDITKLEKAKILIYSGSGMEHWVEKVTSTLQNKDLILVETSKKVPLITRSSTNDGHGHDQKGDSPQMDPHVWLSPLNAKIQLKAIQEGLTKADPANAEYYEKNYQKYAKELDELDQELKAMLLPLKKKEIIVSHAAFGYLCDAYGLEQEAIRGLSPDEEPNPARMKDLILFAKEHQVKVIFFEEMVNPKVSEAIAREVGAEVMRLNPLENLTEKEIQQGDDYISVMRRNGQSLQKALMK